MKNLKWGVWIIARLGGWKGYASEKRPGPQTIHRGLSEFYKRAEFYWAEKAYG